MQEIREVKRPLRLFRRHGRLLLLRLGRGLLHAVIRAGGELRLELLNAACRVDVLQLAGEKRVTSRADIDLQLLPGTAGGEGVAAATADRRGDVRGVNAVFHGERSCDKTGKRGQR